ncbi:MAG: glycosyltransferase [Ruminococcus sp.]|nr:glycosyltransferase [Ruminococcus sp.]
MVDGLVSIIVPIYNCEDYIAECIESVIGQTYKEIELILVNDGSTDSSLKICEDYEKIDKRIKVYSYENSGVSKTREIGYKKSSGKYVTFIDADDSIKSDYIEKLYESIQETGADVVCCNSIDEGVVNLYISENEIIEDKATLVEAFFNKKRYAYCTWGKLYRTELLKGIKFRNMKYAEDTYYVTEVFQKVKKVVLLNYAGYFYRDNPNGAMNNPKGIQQAVDILTLNQYILNLCRTSYPQFQNECIINIDKNLFMLICSASKSSKEDRKKAYLIVKEYTSNCKEVLKKNNIKNMIVKIYIRLPFIVTFLLRTKKSLERILRKSV